MAIAKDAAKALLFCGIMYRTQKERDEALKLFCKEYGTILRECGPLKFSDLTAYYDGEMGDGISKEYLLFDRYIKREELADIKLFTNELEETFAQEGNRQINLDPGYLTFDKFVLASAKDYFHRIYIGKGIYAEVTLHFKQDKIRIFSWTYNDYKADDVQHFLLQGRNILRQKP